MEQSLNRNRKAGFTLIELLVVISIIAILSLIGMAVYSNVQKNARDAKRRGDIQAISTALELYKSVNGSYPLRNAISIEDNWGCTNGVTVCLKNELAPFIQGLPIDPQNIGPWDTGKFYKYHTNADGTFYQVAASLEDKSASTGNFTYMCSPGCDGTGDPTGAHNDCNSCTFDNDKGGFGIDSRQ